MAERLLLDTDVLIDYLRGRAEAITYVEGQTVPLLISAVSVAELYAGGRDGSERQALDTFITAFEIVAVSRDIAVKGGLFRRDYDRSHGTGLADAVIAATCEVRQAELVSSNKRHFPMLAQVHVPYQRA